MVRAPAPRRRGDSRARTADKDEDGRDRKTRREADALTPMPFDHEITMPPWKATIKDAAVAFVVSLAAA